MKELEHIGKLVVANPNDYELGKSVRSFIASLEANEHKFIQCVKCGSYQSLVNHHCKTCKNEI